MGVLDQIKGMFSGEKDSKLLQSVQDLVDEGKLSLSKLKQNFDSAGLGDKVESWIGRGENKSISAEEIKRGADPQNLQELADKAGVSVDEAAEGLSKTLPSVVDKLTPDGVLPSDDEIKSSLRS